MLVLRQSRARCVAAGLDLEHLRTRENIFKGYTNEDAVSIADLTDEGHDDGRGARRHDDDESDEDESGDDESEGDQDNGSVHPPRSAA